LIYRFSLQLRVPVDEERMGLDESKHGGHAYPEHSLIMRTLATRLLNNADKG
jgi:ammonia channel protein AmtB